MLSTHIGIVDPSLSVRRGRGFDKPTEDFWTATIIFQSWTREVVYRGWWCTPMQWKKLEEHLTELLRAGVDFVDEAGNIKAMLIYVLTDEVSGGPFYKIVGKLGRKSGFLERHSDDPPWYWA